MPAAQRLERLGLGALARRPVRTLTPDEARGVALVEAITSQAQVLLVEEPFAALDPRAASAVAAALRGRAREGACVIVSTASVRDALDLADEVLTFDRGALVRRAPVTDPLATSGIRGAAMRAVVSDARALLAALAHEPACEAAAAEAGAVVASGADVIALADAIARAVLRAGVTLDALHADVRPLPELRAAIAGDAAGAYRAAFERAHGIMPAPFGASMPPPNSPPMPPPSSLPPAAAPPVTPPPASSGGHGP
jgi:ABC-type multidrug transport system ATPase subunit